MLKQRTAGELLSLIASTCLKFMIFYHRSVTAFVHANITTWLNTYAEHVIKTVVNHDSQSNELVLIMVKSKLEHK